MRKEVAVEIVSSRDRTSRKGEAEYFTGGVWIDEIAVGAEPSRVRALLGIRIRWARCFMF
jgi:hypothetical protein